MNTSTNGIEFPDGPKLEFEILLGQLIERAHEVMSSQVRLRHLITANNAVASDLDLPTVLARIAEVARDLIGARYAALGVISPDGHLEQFIHVGMDEEIVARIGHLPEGKGLLGALIQEPQPISLRRISDDQRSSGFPANHPPMDSFLGVPIRVRDEVYGNLYLTDHESGEFSADDQELAGALAAAAGIAIANARLFEESTYRERLSSAFNATTRHMLADDEDGAIDLMTKSVRDMADADLVCVALASADHEQIVIDRALGIGAKKLLHSTYPIAEGAIRELLDLRELRTVNDISACPPHGLLRESKMGEAILIPFDVNSGKEGVLLVARKPGRTAFLERDQEMATAFANQITLAVERAGSRSHHHKMELLEDRSRIARDLHDHVIQRLFAAGLSLQAVASGLGPGDASRRITEQIKDIDDTIGQIRESIFALKSTTTGGASGLRSRVREVVDRVSDQLSKSPRIRFLGPVDLMSDRQLTDDAVAVVTEGLANILRHAEATTMSISISAAEGQLSIEIVDDGIGLRDKTRFSGLDNLRDRADHRGGSFEIQQAKPRGTRLAWSVPV